MSRTPEPASSLPSCGRGGARQAGRASLPGRRSDTMVFTVRGLGHDVSESEVMTIPSKRRQ